jgi:hypothetical protein
MVDFDNEATVGTPAADIVRILILQRRSDLFEALEAYRKRDYLGASSDISTVRARLNTLFLEIQGTLKRRLKEEEYKDLLIKIGSNKEEEILGAIYFLNEYLDALKLTRIDTRKEYDKTRVEHEHKAKRM